MNNDPDRLPLVPRIYDFRDIDEFRSRARRLDIDFTPLVRSISAQQTILDLPGCGINFTKSFPRIIDAQVLQDSTGVLFAMDHGVPIRINGVERDQSFIVIGSGGARCHLVERTERQHVTITFTPQISDRGWPEASQDAKAFQTSHSAHYQLRSLVREILAVATTFDPAEGHEAWPAIRESVLAGIDAAFSDVVPAKRTARTNSIRQFRLFQQIREAICASIGAPIYNSDLAKQLGVSVRTLHSTVQQYTGMSLHRYLRLRRLWLVRRQLLAGAPSVKACALAFGFWHLGDFSRSYRVQFGETPSETLARARSV